MVKTREHNFQPTQSHHKVRRNVSSQLVRWTLLNYSRASPLRLWGSSTSHSSTLAYKARHSIFAQRGCGRQQGGSETNKRAPKHTQRYRFGVRILGGNTPVTSHTAQATASARHVDARGGRWERQGREVSRAEARPPPPSQTLPFGSQGAWRQHSSTLAHTASHCIRDGPTNSSVSKCRPN